MAIFRCKMCGGDLEVQGGETSCVCEFCGTRQTLPSNQDENLQALFNRANILRIKSEFDKAADIYEKILQADETEAEAYWGMILCKYGIEYVEDPATFKRIPTCHRASYDAVSTDEDYKNALKYADTVQREIYEAEAARIETIQKGILTIAQKESPYDVFICYKETDDSGKRTQDSVIANDIYYQLTHEGYKVFYAAISLEDKLGSEYEPVIFSALNTAKVMLVLGTKREYFNAVWVKNEWSRFLKIMKKDRTKLMIPCYKDMDPYELPEEFAHLQALDMSRIGFIQDLIRGIKKICGKDQQKVNYQQPNTDNSGSAPTSSLLRRAFMFLEDGNWQEADQYCEKVLDIEPENAQAYLGKLMAELQVKTSEQLAEQPQPFDDRNSYQKAIRFGDEHMRAQLTGYVTQLENRLEYERKTNIYNQAMKAANDASRYQSYNQFKNARSNFQNASELFRSVSGFKDADMLAEQCSNSAKICENDAIYQEAQTKMVESAQISDLESAIQSFQRIPGWRDSNDQIVICSKRIAELNVMKERERLESERIAEQQRSEAEKAGKKRKRKILMVSIILTFCVTFMIVFFTVILPNTKYSQAMNLYNNGRYEEAITTFEAMNGYKDSQAQIEKCKTAIKDQQYNSALALYNEKNYTQAYPALIALNGYKDSMEKAKMIYPEYEIALLKNANVGDYVLFGSYEQDNDTSNGKEQIEWIILDKKGASVLLLSKYSLDGKQFNDKKGHASWESSTLRRWLNSEFLNTAFSSGEQNAIQKTKVLAEKNPTGETTSEKYTEDMVFLMSYAESGKFYSARTAEATAYAKSQGASWWWWIYWKPDSDINCSACVTHSGSMFYNGDCADHLKGAVRPAIWINLDSVTF